MLPMLLGSVNLTLAYKLGHSRLRFGGRVSGLTSALFYHPTCCFSYLYLGEHIHRYPTSIITLSLSAETIFPPTLFFPHIHSTGGVFFIAHRCVLTLQVLSNKAHLTYYHLHRVTPHQTLAVQSESGSQLRSVRHT